MYIHHKVIASRAHDYFHSPYFEERRWEAPAGLGQLTSGKLPFISHLNLLPDWTRVATKPDLWARSSAAMKK